MALAIAHPWWAATIAFVLLAAGAYLLYRLAGRLRRVKRRYDAWGERVGIATPPGGLPHVQYRTRVTNVRGQYT